MTPMVEAPGRPAKILVVDDEANICALLSATLRLTGFDVRVAGGARRLLLGVTALALRAVGDEHDDGEHGQDDEGRDRKGDLPLETTSGQ